MLRSYVVIALKHLTTQKLYSAINVLGLTVGLACFALITLFVRYELSFDTQWTDADRIYRVSRDYFAHAGARARVPASLNAPFAPALVADFPQVEQAARLIGGRSEQAGRVFGQRALLSREELSFYEDRLRFADGSIFEIFDFEWLRGEPEQALDGPGSIVLSESLARKYFGRDDPIGETLTFNGNQPLAVTGVIRDLPQNTHLSIDALASMSTLTGMAGPGMLQNWNGNTDFHTYIRLSSGTDIAALESEIPNFLDRHVEDGSSFSGLTFMNVADIHLRSNRDEEWKSPGNLVTALSFAAIALGILLIACINFMNLSTARAATRAREVAVRKSMGASKAQMVVQFLGESTLLAAIGTILAIALVEIALPSYRAFTGAELPFDYLGDPVLFLSLVTLPLVVGLVAGSYPAFYLSAFEPARVLKGEVTHGASGAAFRNTLVVFQFAIAIVLVIGTAVVYEQTTFARNLDLGFDKERIVVLNGSARLGSQWPAFKEELLADPGILNVTASHYTPFSFDDNSLTIRERGTASASRIQYMRVDYDFFETYEIDVLDGRSFSENFGSDAVIVPSAENPVGSGGFIINESAARLLGWPADAAVGKPLDIGLSEDFASRIEGTIVGLVGDTHFESVSVPVRPLMFVLVAGPAGNLTPNVASIRLSPDNLQARLDHIDDTWYAFMPDQPVARHFLDQDFEALYQAEWRQGRMLASFSLLAVFVACLGLLGLASFSTEQRSKEIGVRKVMGGTVLDIVRLFTGEFSRLVVLAGIIAFPVAYLLMRQWLANFAYRVDLSLVVFVGGGLIALAVALLTVGTIVARAAMTNPIHSLRYE